MKRNKTLDKILNKDFYIVLLTIWLIINANAYIRASRVSNIGSIILGVYAMLVLVYDILTEGRNYFEFPGIIIGVLMVLASILSLLGNRCAYPVKNIYSIISVSVNFLLLYSYGRQPNCIKTLTTSGIIIMIATTIVSLINIWMLYSLVSIPVGEAESIFDLKFLGVDLIRGRFTGLSGNANGLARFSLSGFISSFILLVKVDSFRNFKYINAIPTLSIFSMIVNALVIFLSQSRGTILSLFVGVLGYIMIFLFHSLRQPQAINKISLVLKNLVLVSFLVVIFYNGSSFIVRHMPYRDVEKVGSEQIEEQGLVDRDERDKDILDDDITNGRLIIMKNGINATLDKNPVFGLTYGGNYDAIRAYIDENHIEVPDYIYRTAGAMHNTIIQSFVNYGLIGLLVMILFVLRLVIVFVQSNFKTIQNPKDLQNMALYTFVFGIMLVLNMVEYVFYFDFSNHLVNFILMIAAGCFSLRYQKKERSEEA